jgi:hypothetical protein
LIVFLALSLNQPIVQDDAYISFRYADNFLSGKGLVYNGGERTEGYTNFLWVIILISFKSILNINYLLAARLFGVASGLLILIITYLYSSRCSKANSLLIFSCTAILLLFNQSIPYWSMSGLETVAFAAISLLALFCEDSRPRLTAPFLTILSLLRPEGFIIFLVVVAYRVIINRQLPVRFSILYFLPLIPFLLFRLYYYGSILPNTYYAKSGIGIEYIVSGIEYFLSFSKSIGVYGLIIVLPILMAKWLWGKYTLLYIYVFIYICFVIGIGGDTLKVYRFFVPILPALYLLFIASVIELLSRMQYFGNMIRNRLFSVTLLLSILIGLSSYWLARNHIATVLRHKSLDIRI